MLRSNISNNLVYKRKQYYDYALAILALLMPLVVKGFPVLIVISAIIGILYFFRAYQKLGKPKKDYYLLPYNLLKDSFKNLIKGKNAMLLMVILFFIYFISAFYSTNKDNAWQKLLLKSSYLYFPLIFALTKWDKDKLVRVIDFFIYGCILQVLISLFDAFVASGFAFERTEFMYVKLSYNMHPSYAALITTIGFVFTVIRLLFVKRVPIRKTLKALYFSSLILFTIYIFLLSSKSGFISYILATISLLIFSYIVLSSFKIILTYLISLAIIFIILFPLIGGKLERKFNEMFYAVNKVDETHAKTGHEKISSSEIRLVLWENSVKTIKGSPVYGFGIGDGKDELQKQLLRNHEYFVHGLNHNSHNQYLEILLSTGIIGLVCLLLILIFSSFGFGGFTWITVLLVLIIAVNFAVESVMEKQVGIIPITWLLTFLVSGKNTLKTVFQTK